MLEAVFSSLLPFFNMVGSTNRQETGQKFTPTFWSFLYWWNGLLASVLWTSFRTKEYPPEEYTEIQ